ncbi:MAG: glycosyl transferase [Ruminococcaceae bacterium]|nr:glycosyl transferase [Oscillospiraceae bacterium]
MKKIKRLFLLIIIVLMAVCTFEVKLGYDFYKEALSEMPLETAIQNLKEKENYTEFDNIPEIYFQAVVAVEDRRFYKHKGVDFIGTARAIYIDLKTKELREGGSTISQQLAKNIYFPLDYTLKRKIAEIFMACKIEHEYSKKNILEYYANIIYFGSGYYCIYDAAEGYFGKTPDRMSPDECTMLAGIPNAPSLYSPKVNIELARKRQDKVIRSMIDCGYIKDRSEITDK